MKKPILLSSVFIVLGSLAMATPTNTASHSVSLEIDPINMLSVTGSSSLHLTSAHAEAGNSTLGTDTAIGAVSLAYTTNQVNQKVTVYIDQALPTGVTFKLLQGITTITFGEGSGTTGVGELNQVDLLTGLSQTADTISLDFSLTATLGAGYFAGSNVITRTLTYTITTGCLGLRMGSLQTLGC